MKAKKILCGLLALFALLPMVLGAYAAEVESGDIYCFTSQDFATEGDLRGICITSLPDPAVGTMVLGNRVLREGDILTAEQIAQMTFLPLKTQEDVQASVQYLPIYDNRVERETEMILQVWGKTDKAPVAEDFSVETYKNLPNEGKLKVTDPEGQQLTFTVLRKPKRGEVTIQEDGSFVYTPKKNKVGVDSFTYTATDPAGNVSREATVTVQILKPTDARQYTDTVGTDCRFEAEWMRNTGLFTGESIGGQACFRPEKTVSRGEFLTMVVKALDIPLEEGNFQSLGEDVPQWLKPYLAAALRSGLVSQWPQNEAGELETDAPITGAEAAVMVQNILDLQIPDEALQTFADADAPDWAYEALAVMAEHGITVAGAENLTRAEVAKMLYEVSRLAATAPGLKAFW
jgi:VCBS repeat-containing protein